MNIMHALALGSLYGFLSLAFVIYYRKTKIVNIVIVSYVVFGAHLTSEFSNSLPLFVATLLAVAIASALAFLIDHYLISPLNGSTFYQNVTSIALTVIVLILTNMFWSSPAKIENPFSASSATEIFIFITFILFIVALAIFYYKSYPGKKLRAFESDPETAISYGAHPLYASIVISIIIGFLSVVGGVLYSIKSDFNSNSLELIVFAIVSLSVVILAQHANLRLVIAGSFIIAFLQTLATNHIDTINNLFHDLVKLVGATTSITVGDTFVQLFLPFVIALISSFWLPKKWVSEK